MYQSPGSYITEFFNITKVDGLSISVKGKSGAVFNFNVSMNVELVDASGVEIFDHTPLIVGGLYRALVNPRIGGGDGLIRYMQSTKFKQRG